MGKKLKEITKANITHISFVPKGANGQDFLIVKSDGVPDLVYESPIIKVDQDKHLVTGVVYAPDVVDSQGEFMKADAIEKAAHDFMQSSRQIDERHNFVTNESVSVVESYVAKADTEVDGQVVKKGTWLITTKVEDDKLWEAVKKGDYKGFSMGGTGTRKEVEVEDKVEKEEQGLFALMKDFFAGNISKEDKANVVVDFKTLAVSEKVDESRWALQEAIRNILRSDADNKKELVAKQIDSYKEYILAQLDTAGIKKMQEEFEGIEKAGKSFSTANAEKIKAAHTALADLITLMESKDGSKEGEGTMTKEEVQAVVKEAMQPITDKLDQLEKGDQAGEPAQEDKLTKEALQEVVKESIKPMMERLEKVEKARGLSNQAEGTEGITKENDRDFSSVMI